MVFLMTFLSKLCFFVLSSVGISSVVVTPSTLIPLASKDMQIFCNVSGLFKSIQWLKDNQILNTTVTNSIYMNDTTVEFHPLQITDDGSYQCVATNTFRPHVSLPYHLIVNCKWLLPLSFRIIYYQVIML